MKKKLIKFSMGLCVIAMLGSSSFNLNAAGGGGGGGAEEENMYLYLVPCSEPGYTRYLCWDAPQYCCDISAQTECPASNPQ